MVNQPRKILNLLRNGLKSASALFLSLLFIAGQAPFAAGYEAHIINVTAKICNYSEIRSCGYWKDHSGVYKPHLPQTLGGYPTDEIINTITKANNILTAACGTCGYDNTMRGKLKGQLLTMKFNIAHFGIGEYLVEGEGKTLNQIAADADNLLRQNPPPSDSVLEAMKNLLEKTNNLEKIRYCSVTPPSEECELQLTKTASSDQISPGGAITYHLTFDNIGKKVCTGGGVRLKDTFGSSLKYLSHTSTRNPNSFNKSTNYAEWNFGNIYPNDPLIEIDLRMEVLNSAQCDSTITNSANYWSNETNWGEPVTVDSQVFCQPTSETGIVINEFLPNAVGEDNEPKPDGEWVELYNRGGGAVDVAGWMLYDALDDHELLIEIGNIDTGNTLIPPGGFLVVYRNGDSDFALNNTGGDTVRLYNGKIGDGGLLIDSHAYTINAPEGKSFARVPDGSSNWIDPVPTPGGPNTAENGDMIFGPALPEQGEESALQEDSEESTVESVLQEEPMIEEIAADAENPAIEENQTVTQDENANLEDEDIDNVTETTGIENEPIDENEQINENNENEIDENSPAPEENDLMQNDISERRKSPFLDITDRDSPLPGT